MFDPLYEEIITNNSDLMIYVTRLVINELVLPMFFFVAVMLTIFIDWSWIPLSTRERDRGPSLEELKKGLFE